MPTDIRPTTGQEALELLKEGNARYVDSLTSTDEYMQRRPKCRVWIKAKKSAKS